MGIAYESIKSGYHRMIGSDLSVQFPVNLAEWVMDYWYKRFFHRISG